ncbi:hypothetical protein [Rhodopirellula sp. P2]|uniref:hypothetical protein n=1 Tax=Rhodopirellula sp. P2 TaxID=2127060 RepID=UPI0023683560|nr:hypothetical protein [Rhodopirellula sp. P2]WDQ16157.1 hypothetical protein PSR62_21375 [Rhodopirellula sp. P2]
MIALQYEYHDANLVSASFGPRREASFVFALYPIFYPECPTVTLRFGGLFNDDATSRFVAAINAEPVDDDSYLARCNTIQIDAKKPSNDGNIYVFVDLEYFGQIRVHCKHLSEVIAST